MAKSPALLHECCVVPYRITSCGAEFCLLTPHAENRWEFPKVRLTAADAYDRAALKRAADLGGLHGQTDEDPLGSYIANRQNETRTMVGFLMHVEDFDVEFSAGDKLRRLWCLAEEARLRIRRKPLRRFIDLALQEIKQHAPAASIRR